MGRNRRPGEPSKARRSTQILRAAFTLMVSAAPLTIHAMDAATSSAIRADLIHGRADEGIDRLHSAIARDGRDAEAHNLLCRFLFQEQRWDDAAIECEQATRLAPGNGEYHMWLGRAYGEKADRVSFVQAYGLGKKVRNEFEAAVTFNPRSPEALADLGEFYSEAPAMIGGGLDKATDVARRLTPIDPGRSHELLGHIAEQRKDTATAESEFKTDIKVAREPASAWTVLASYYRRQQRWDDMMSAIHGAVAADKDHGIASAYAASLLIRTGRDPALAIQLLKDYLSSENQSEDVPAFATHVRLGRLLEKQGDKAGAQREFQAARQLAHDFRGLP